VTYPVIGVTTMRRENPAGMTLTSLAEAYVRALTQAGGIPVLIPTDLDEFAVDELFSRLDGVLFSGGGDVDIQFYDAINHLTVSGVDIERDRLEIHLLRKLIAEGKPFLGICRGLQLINVGLGGSLYTNIADQVSGASKHDYYPGWERDHLAHSVEMVLGTRLAGILGESVLEVNSFHHQGVHQLAPDLIATSHSEDGLVEAVELPGHPFGLAVQWHPEWLTAHAPMCALFQAFVDAADNE
jgi:putative glutamine amidotransferase